MPIFKRSVFNHPGIKGISDETEVENGFWVYLREGWNFHGASHIRAETQGEAANLVFQIQADEGSGE